MWTATTPSLQQHAHWLHQVEQQRASDCQQPANTLWSWPQQQYPTLLEQLQRVQAQLQHIQGQHEEQQAISALRQQQSQRQAEQQQGEGAQQRWVLHSHQQRLEGALAQAYAAQDRLAHTTMLLEQSRCVGKQAQSWCAVLEETLLQQSGSDLSNNAGSTQQGVQRSHKLSLIHSGMVLRCPLLLYVSHTADGLACQVQRKMQIQRQPSMLL